MKNNNGQYRFDLFAYRAFENATWILTDKKSGSVLECDGSQMSDRVEKGYLSYWNRTYSQYPYNEDKLNPEDIIVRCLYREGCDISRVKKGIVVDARYDQILSEYSIDCYGWKYQCSNCRAVLNEIRGKGEKIIDRLYCIHCGEYSKYR